MKSQFACGWNVFLSKKGNVNAHFLHFCTLTLEKILCLLVEKIVPFREVLTRNHFVNLIIKQTYIDTDHSAPPQKGKIIKRLWLELYVGTNHCCVACCCICNF